MFGRIETWFSEITWSWPFFVGKFFFSNDRFSLLLIIGVFQFPISSWFSVQRLFLGISPFLPGCLFFNIYLFDYFGMHGVLVTAHGILGSFFAVRRLLSSCGTWASLHRAWSSCGQAFSSYRVHTARPLLGHKAYLDGHQGKAQLIGTMHIALVAEHPQCTSWSERTLSPSEQDLN